MGSAAGANLYPGEIPASVIRAVAYIGALRLRDDKTGSLYNFASRRLSENPEVLATALYAGKSSDVDPGIFWNAVRRHNTHHNAVAGRPMIAPICNDLTLPGMWRCLSIFARYLRRKYGVGVFVGFHGPKYNEAFAVMPFANSSSVVPHNSNYHGHLMLSYCAVDRDGHLGNKEPRLDPISCDRLGLPPLFRVEGPIWADIQNRQLAIEGSGTKVSFRPEPFPGEVPLSHMGAAVAAMERRGIRTQVGNKNRRIVMRNAGERRRRQYVERMDRIISTMEAVDVESLRFGGHDTRRRKRRNWLALLCAAKLEPGAIVDDQFGVIVFPDGSGVVAVDGLLAVASDRAECKARTLLAGFAAYPLLEPKAHERERHIEVIHQGIAKIDGLGSSRSLPLVTWQRQFQEDDVASENDEGSGEAGTADGWDLIQYESDLRDEIDQADAAERMLAEDEFYLFEADQAQAIEAANSGGGVPIDEENALEPPVPTEDGDA